MGYRQRVVAPGIEVWRSSTGPVGRQRILPAGCMDLVLAGGRLLVAGPDTSARVHRLTEPQTVVGVRLHAGRAPALLGVPADELRDRTVLLEDVWSDRRARLLTEQVLERPAPALASWASTERAVDPFGEHVCALLYSGSSVGEVADAVGYSPRQLHRRLLPVFGYGPQRLSRVLRLVRVVADADTGSRWSDVAQRAGFADQAHLVREVRALTGVTPGELRDERVRSFQDAA
jgi:AraC-like DNA-binding protein